MNDKLLRYERNHQAVLMVDCSDYKGNYLGVNNENLKNIFAALHSSLDKHAKLMNDKSKTFYRHYKADDSRRFIDLIDAIKELQAMNQGTDLSFHLDPDYDAFINNCRNFLSTSNGSEIPDEYVQLTLKRESAVFIMDDESIFCKKSSAGLRGVPRFPIGSGSYATVYRYTDPDYSKTFCVKCAKKELDEQEKARFKNEFVVLKSLRSPYIIEVYSFNEDKFEYTMECADMNLRDYLNKNKEKVTVKERRKIVLQVCQALKCIHKRELMHRDLSLSNILIWMYEDCVVAKLADFGLVKIPDRALTNTQSSIKGSLNTDPDLNGKSFGDYQLHNEIYALCMLINQIMCNDLPASMKPDMHEFLMRGLSLVVENRYKDVEEVSMAFREFVR